MAWTTPKTYSSGDILTASDMNTYQRDQLRWLGGESTGGKPMCVATRSTNLSITTATTTAVPWNGSADIDTDTMHDTGTNPERITLTTAGVYLFGACIEWQADTTGHRRLSILEVGGNIICDSTIETSSAEDCTQAISRIRAFAAADYIRVNVRQTSGGGLNVNSTEHTKFWALWVGDN